MIKQLLYKWFGLEDAPCASCELLRAQLELCNTERKELLTRLLDKNNDREAPVDTKNLQPIHSSYVPWRVRQQMLETEDREKAKLLREKAAEMDPAIAKLEKELGVENA
jgi:hypothetical protein